MTEIERVPIPNTKGYTVTRNGDVYSAKGELCKVYTNGDGYKGVSIQWQGYKRKSTVGLQRLLLLTFKPPPINPVHLTANHKDRDVANNDLDNLEWLSVAHNNLHAALTEENPLTYRIVVISNDGDINFFYNLKGAAEYLTDDTLIVTEDDVFEGIVNDTQVGSFKYYSVKHFGSKTGLPSEARRACIRTRLPDGTVPKMGVKLLSVITDQIVVFGSMAEAASHYGVTPSHISQCLSRDGKISAFQNEWIIVKADEDFPDISDAVQRRITTSGPREVLAYCYGLDMWMIYPSARKFIQTYNLSKKAVTTILRQGKLRVVNDFIFAYLNSDLINEMKSIVSRPG